MIITANNLTNSKGKSKGFLNQLNEDNKKIKDLNKEVRMLRARLQVKNDTSNNLFISRSLKDELGRNFADIFENDLFTDSESKVTYEEIIKELLDYINELDKCRAFFKKHLNKDEINNESIIELDQIIIDMKKRGYSDKRIMEITGVNNHHFDKVIKAAGGGTDDTNK